MVRTSSLPKSLSIFVCAITLALLSSCTQNKTSSSVQITIPDFSKVKSKAFSQSVSAQAEGDGGEWGLSDPASLSEFKCFGVFVGAADSGLDTGKAFGISENLLFSFGIAKGLVGPGGTISLSVPSGPKRTFTLIGFALASGASCESLTNENHEITSSFYSAPFILAQATVDLVPGDAPPITLTATYNAATSVKLGDVQFPGSSGGGSGSGGPSIYLGSGLDGDISVSGAMNLNTMTNVEGTRYLSTSARVSDLGRPDAANFPNKYSVSITGSASPYGALHFNTGDEVLLYVSAANGTGCGPEVWPGFSFFGKVLSAPVADVMSVSFTNERVRTIPSAPLAVNVAATNFCRVSITRVPQINKLTLNPSSVLKMQAFSGHSAFSQGGVMLLRVRDRIVMSGTGTATIYMSQSGYRGGSASAFPGEGEMGHPLAANLNAIGAGGGGGSAGTAAGGGAHGDVGQPGNGGTNGGYKIGDQYGCNEASPGNSMMHCLLGKIFMGGGGGAHGTGATNHGGGIISIAANNVILAAGQALNIESIGGNGNSSGGGGAGGAILLRALNLQVSGASNSLNLYAYGGGAGGTHGAGTGGRVHLDVLNSCNVAPSGVSSLVTGGTSYTPVANSGTQYFTGAAIASCPVPTTSPAL